MTGWRVCLALILAAPAAGSSTTSIQSYNTYKSWLAACDNTLDCEAKGFDESGDKRAEMVLTRGAGAQGAVTVRMAAETKFTLADVRIDGQPLRLEASNWTVSNDEEGTSIDTDNAVAIHSLVARLRNGTKVSLGREGAEVPLDGFVAALLRIDERQGRIGGVTALIRTGTTPAAHVPEPLPVPFIPRRPIKAMLSLLEANRLIKNVRTSQSAVFKKEDCEDDIRAEDENAWALDDDRALVMIPCLEGAYQGSSLAFIASRKGVGPIAQVIAPMPYLGSDPKDEVADMFTEGDFDPKTGSLSMSAKGRGLADCGMSAEWIWDGAHFQMSSLAVQDACGGLEPGDWPTIFMSKQ